VALLLRDAAAVAPLLPPLGPCDRRGPLPLSFAQQRLWFLDRLHPHTLFYSIPCAVRLTGQLNLRVLDQSIQGIIQRHDVLRTTFTLLDRQPIQRIGTHVSVPLVVVDLSARAESWREACVARLNAEEVAHPFDLSQGPLVRTTLLRLAPEEHLLLLTVHHIVFDAWSLGIFFRELASLYTAHSRGEPAALPALPIQYADYALWQRGSLQGAALDEHLAYWRQQLAGAPAHLRLPTDFPSPVVRSYHGAVHHFRLSPRLSANLHSLSQQEGVTLFMTLLTGFALVLGRYSGQQDLLIGSPIAGRTQRETEGVIGMFINLLVLRVDLGKQPTVRQLLARVRELCLEAYAHQEVPFEQLVEVMHPARSLTQTPLFQVLFTLQNVIPVLPEIADLKLTLHSIDDQTAKFDISLSFREEEQDLVGSFEYNTDIFEIKTIMQMERHLTQLLTGLVINPDQYISQLSMLTETERDIFITKWARGSQVPLPVPATICACFQRQVARTPESIALIWEDEHFTYGQVDGQANMLAHFLHSLGVGSEVRVGLSLNRSPGMVVSLLAILKAGGAYVPLDPSYPPARLVHLVQDAGVQLILGDARTLLPFAESSEVFLLDLNTSQTILALQSYPCTSPVGEIWEEQAAYVMYTSGSTGQPKGVVIHHRAVVRLVCPPSYVLVQPSDRFLHLSPLAFDASTFEIWGALLNGSHLVLAPAQLQGLKQMSVLLGEQQISHLWLTAGLFQHMVEHEPAALTKVAHLLAGGDVLLPSPVEYLLRQPLHGDLINGYGPTENTTFTCTAYLTLEHTKAVGKRLPIGYPIAHTQVYVLDSRMHPVPFGVTGELYVGGLGLARGYAQRPDLTAERFVPHPFSKESGTRLYRTGDQVCWRSDGQLEFVGRQDGQVKIRGFRVEFGEVEALCRAHPVVNEAVAVVWEPAPGDKRLVVYVSAKTAQKRENQSGGEYTEPEAVPTLNTLRQWLEERVPSYLVPSEIIEVNAWPLTSQGKVDRHALPFPGQGHPPFGHLSGVPQTRLERYLAKVWQEVLHVEQIGLRDNFFDLGGHSLLLIQAQHILETHLGYSLPLVDFFRHPNIASLAAYLNRRQIETSSASADDSTQQRAAMRQDLLMLQRNRHRQSRKKE
jgi:amino acid adenylation domain-containing protein